MSAAAATIAASSSVNNNTSIIIKNKNISTSSNNNSAAAGRVIDLSLNIINNRNNIIINGINGLVMSSPTLDLKLPNTTTTTSTTLLKHNSPVMHDSSIGNKDNNLTGNMEPSPDPLYEEVKYF